MCFVLKHGNLDKFESHSSNSILLGYTPHGRSYRVFNLETNTVLESCDVTFDKMALSHLSFFTNILFIALFEPQDVGHTLF
jgi:hypothetical protein